MSAFSAVEMMGSRFLYQRTGDERSGWRFNAVMYLASLVIVSRVCDCVIDSRDSTYLMYSRSFSAPQPAALLKTVVDTSGSVSIC